MGYDDIEHSDNPTDTDTGTPSETPDDDRAAIDEERARRLDPANRPDDAEVDNTDVTLPTVEKFAELNANDDDVEGSVGTADPTAAFRAMEVSDEERAEIEAERERRLDPANRPDNAEVDNTGRTMEDGHFVD